MTGQRRPTFTGAPVPPPRPPASAPSIERRAAWRLASGSARCCGSCDHLGLRLTCLDPVSAGLVRSFGIVRRDRTDGAACPAWQHWAASTSHPPRPPRPARQPAAGPQAPESRDPPGGEAEAREPGGVIGMGPQRPPAP